MADEYEVPPGQLFGTWDAPLTDCDVRIDAPVGRACIWCEEKVLPGDNGRISWAGYVEHRECSLRNVMGGIGHYLDHAQFCRGELGTDAGLSRRQSSLLVWRLFQRSSGTMRAKPADWAYYTRVLQAAQKRV